MSQSVNEPRWWEDAVLALLAAGGVIATVLWSWVMYGLVCMGLEIPPRNLVEVVTLVGVLLLLKSLFDWWMFHSGAEVQHALWRAIQANFGAGVCWVGFIGMYEWSWFNVWQNDILTLLFASSVVPAPVFCLGFVFRKSGWVRVLMRRLALLAAGAVIAFGGTFVVLAGVTSVRNRAPRLQDLARVYRDEIWLGSFGVT